MKNWFVSLGAKGLTGTVLAAIFILQFTGTAFAGGGAKPEVPDIWWLAPIGSVLGLIFAGVFYLAMKKANPGDENMVRIAGYVKKGAMAYLKQQYKIVAIVFVILSLILAVLAFGLKVQSEWVPFAFITGGFFSGLSGFLGMKTATEASSRTAQGAKESLDRGLKIAFRSGAVMGLIVVGLGLLDISIWFYVLYNFTGLNLEEITVTMLCFGMGASTQALFARVGGGIFTKSADVGADLVGKVEAGIPEDDPRNPAVIADNVGDNVGDVAGMGADLYESYCGSILATAALGVAAGAALGLGDADKVKLLITPMLISGIGIVLSLFGIYMVRTKEGATQKQLLGSLMTGINVSSILILALSGLICYYMFNGTSISFAGIWLAIVTGLAAGVGIGYITGYYTSNDYSPTKGIASQSRTGPATVIIEGLAVGMLSTALPVIIVCVGVILSFAFAGGFANPIMGLYGISIASVGMLSTLGITLATDAYGPIADNAGGNAQMTHQDPSVRERTDALDSLGNTTAATGKGFAIGSAALTALALLAAYIEEIRIGMDRMVANGEQIVVNGVQMTSEAIKNLSISDFMIHYDITLMNPKVLIGLFLGSMMVFVFCALTMKAVGRAASKMVEEVRRQFKEIAGLMEGKAEADYATCVQIATKGAQMEMIFPSMLALSIPVVTGLLLGVAGVMGLLAGALSTGFVVAVMMANSGGAWDNAKKYVEGGELGGKGSNQHKATVVGDTVGDPFKDTAGPSLNILIKLMSMVSVVFAGLVVKYSPQIMDLLGISGKK